MADIAAQLLALRNKKLRIDPSRPISNVADAINFVTDRRIVTVTGREALASLSDAIAGYTIRGSWMADKSVHKIYSILSSLPEEQVFQAKAINGKWAAFDSTLAPAIVRIVLDTERRKREIQQLPVMARNILERVEHESCIRADKLPWPRTSVRNARTVLERSMLLTSRNVHTSSGKHEAELRTWNLEPMVELFRCRAERLRLDDALDSLLCACLTSAVVASEGSVRKWFGEAEARLEHLVASGRACRGNTRPTLVWLHSILKSEKDQ